MATKTKARAAVRASGKGSSKGKESPLTPPSPPEYRGRGSRKAEASGKAAAPAELMPVARIPLERIRASATNPRKHFDEGRLAELAETIKTHGMLQPVIVRPTAEGYELVAGERRFRAAGLAGETTIPAVVRDLDDMTARKLQVIENEQREDLTAIEKAAGYREVLALGVKVEDLAREIGKSPAAIYGLLRLLELPTAAQEKVTAGELSASTGELIARIPSAKLREQAYLAVAGGEDVLSYRQARAVVRERFMVELKQAPFDIADAKILPAAGACTACPKLAANNREEFPDGRGDVCTDPPCFERKRMRAAAQAGGSSEAEAAAVEATAPARRERAAAVEDVDQVEDAGLVGAKVAVEDLEHVIVVLEEQAEVLRQIHQKLPQRKALDELMGMYVAKLRWLESMGRTGLGVFRGGKGGDS